FLDAFQLAGFEAGGGGAGALVDPAAAGGQLHPDDRLRVGGGVALDLRLADEIPVEPQAVGAFVGHGDNVRRLLPESEPSHDPVLLNGVASGGQLFRRPTGLRWYRGAGA